MSSSEPRMTAEQFWRDVQAAVRVEIKKAMDPIIERMDTIEKRVAAFENYETKELSDPQDQQS